MFCTLSGKKWVLGCKGKSHKSEVSFMNREKPENVLRGQMYYANLDPVIGSEQGGDRKSVV